MIPSLILAFSFASQSQEQWLVLNPGKKPLFLYGISCGASLLTLIAYVLGAADFDLPQKWQMFWSLNFLFIIVVILKNLLSIGFSPGRPEVEKETVQNRKNLLIESAVTAALLASLTNYLTSLSSVSPLLWVIPLCLYLLGWIIPFSQSKYSKSLVEKIWPTMATLGLVVYIIGHQIPVDIVLIFHLAALFFVTLGIHQQIYRYTSGNATKGISISYLYIAVGSVLGTVFSSLIAPHLFSSFLEVPICFACSRFVYNSARKTNRKKSVFKSPRVYWVPLFAVPCGFWFYSNSHRLDAAIESFSYIIWLPLLAIPLFRKIKPITIAASCYVILLSLALWESRVLLKDRSLFAPIVVMKRRRDSSTA